MEHRKVSKRILTAGGSGHHDLPPDRRHGAHAHAHKQHDAQTIALGTVLGTVSVYFVHRQTATGERTLAAAAPLARLSGSDRRRASSFRARRLLTRTPEATGRCRSPGQLIADAVIVPLVGLACLIGARDEETEPNAGAGRMLGDLPFPAEPRLAQSRERALSAVASAAANSSSSLISCLAARRLHCNRSARAAVTEGLSQRRTNP